MAIDLIMNAIQNHGNMRFEDLKLSYVILKPNAAKHYKIIMDEIEVNRFKVLGQYAIVDYETVNMALHIEQPESMKYILPISRMYNDFYGNYAVLVVIAKANITYENFCIQVVSLKRSIRTKFELPYISYVFDTSELGKENEHQRLIIMSKEGKEIEKDQFNKEGTFMVFSMNELHSPDEEVSSTVKEMNQLLKMGCFDESMKIPKTTVGNMKRYHTFEFLKDLL